MKQQSANDKHAVSYYTILGLPTTSKSATTTISKDELKTAYHRTLLLNHPDKVPKLHREQTSAPTLFVNNGSYSIDEIVQAYQTLSNTKLKADYDNQLRMSDEQFHEPEYTALSRATHPGVEVCDLEDLEYDDASGKWSKSCRCGDEDGYTVSEAELEKESKTREIYVGCRGCSLFIKILFDLMEEEVTAER